MPTPSSSRIDPPSPRFYPLSSCPDPDEQQPTLQPTSENNPTSLTPRSPSSWRPLSPPTYPDDHGTRLEAPRIGESRSATMSPGPRTEIDASDVRMRHESERMITAGDNSAERHKPADVDTQMSPMVDEPSRGGDAPHGGVASARSEGSRTTVGSDPSGERRSSAEQATTSLGEIPETDVWGPVGRGPRWAEDSGLMGLGLEYSHMRVLTPAPSLYLQPGSRYVGTQRSDRQRYDVEVEIKHVDMRESFLCGYLKIQGVFLAYHCA